MRGASRQRKDPNPSLDRHTEAPVREAQSADVRVAKVMHREALGRLERPDAHSTRDTTRRDWGMQEQARGLS